MPSAPPFAVVVLGCVVGLGQGAADHAGLAVVSCVAALAGLWLLLETGEGT
jgi:hypothetical protein